jgi:Tfp pilus assembly protein PilN
MKRLNLRPPRESRLTARVIAWGALFVILPVVALVTVTTQFERDRLARERRSLQQEAQAVEAEAARLRPLVALTSEARRSLRELRASEAPRGLAARLEAAIPEGVWLSSLSLGTAQVRVTGSSLRWPAVEEFVQRLRGAGLAVQLQSVSREAGTLSVFRFALVIPLGPGRRP